MLLSTVVYTMFALWSVLGLILALPVLAVLPFRMPAERERTVRFVILWYGKLIIRAAWFPFVRVRYENPDHAPCKGGIYVFNHRSASDPFLAAAITDTPPVQLVNDWPMRLPVFGWFARQGGYFDVKHMPYETIRDRIRELTRAGVPVVAFPEGTRSGGAEMGQFHGLVFRIAREIGCPLIPVAVAGNERIPDRSFRMHAGRILLRRLPEIPAGLIASYGPYRLKNHVRRILGEAAAVLDSRLNQGEKR